jgi:hypothetical protein
MINTTTPTFEPDQHRLDASGVPDALRENVGDEQAEQQGEQVHHTPGLGGIAPGGTQHPLGQ